MKNQTLDGLWPIDHIGIAVTNLDDSIALYQKSFGFSLQLREVVPTQKVEVAFMQCANTLIEFLQSTDPSSTLAKFLEKRGPGLHHICYLVKDINLELDRLQKLGFELIDKTPRQGAHNSLIAFLHPKSTQGVLTELCQHR